MMAPKKILVVIPARGGSKGIPRKNLRPLAGRPLLAYSIENGLALGDDALVVVSSEDEEILAFASHFEGVQTIKRSDELSGDLVTLDSVIADALDHVGGNFKYVVTLQPTSPTLKAESIKKAIDIAETSQGCTVISSKEIRHLFWSKDGDDRFKAFHPQRVNRQQLAPVYFETGGVVVCDSNYLRATKTRLTKDLKFVTLDESEAIDIDSDADWALAEHIMTQKKVAIIVIGSKTIGMGHIYNCLELASELVKHKIRFFIGSQEDLAIQKVTENNYKVSIYNSESELMGFLDDYSADVIINDTLNTSEHYTKLLKIKSKKLVCIEDLGEGRLNADLVINAMYESRTANELSGAHYFCLRSDLARSTPNIFNEEVKKVLLFFGGADPSSCTKKVLDSVYLYCVTNKMKVSVVLGTGNDFSDDESYPQADFCRNVKDMSKYLKGVDIAFTSAGRSAFEVYSMCIPSIVLCQNEKEMTHPFARFENGFFNLGLAETVSEETIFEKFLELTKVDVRKSFFEKMGQMCLRTNRKRIIDSILK